MSTTTKIIRAVMKKATRKKPKVTGGKITENVISEADIGRRKPNFTQAQVDEMLKKDKLKEKASKAIDKGIDYIDDKSKKFSEAAGKELSKDRSWIKKNPVKTGVATIAGVASLSGGDDDDLSSEIKKIKAKDPSERTAAEKRLLRIMEED